jgi:NAD(P)-dependent dehydrogenase (short-subunit alcohol dehydrogenase family)
MFDRMLKIHLYGTFYCTREALPRMRAHGNGGRIINMGSIMGTASLAGAPDYCAAKGAIMAFTRAVAREAASYGVLVNAVAPGFIETPLLDDLDETARRVVKMQTPLARLGVPAEIAAVALFLAGPDSTFMTGQVVSPNGGIYMSQ